MWRLLIDMFQSGEEPDHKLCEMIHRNSFEAFELENVASVLPAPLKFILPLNEPWLEGLVAGARKHRALLARRIGHDWMPQDRASIVTRDEDDVWVTREDLKPLDDVCTKFCTKSFFPDAFARFNMILNLVRLYDKVAALDGNRFDIIFKGGVMVRMVLLQALQDLSMPARHRAIEYLTEHRAIDISDFDFEVVAHDPSASDVYANILLTFAALLWMQRAMQRELKHHKGAEIGLLNNLWDREQGELELVDMLNAEVKELPETHAMHGATVDQVVLEDRRPPPAGYVTRSGADKPAPRRNRVMFTTPDGTFTLADARAVFAECGLPDVVEGESSALYATLNTHIGEGTERTRKDELLSAFHLARIKYSATMYYTTKRGERRCDRIAGEMIDLSHAHNTDEKHVAMYEAVRMPYRTYPIVGVNVAKLRSYSPEGFLFDHHTMLHARAERPSEVPKLEKRIVRYIAFFVIHVLSSWVERPYETKLRALRELVRALEENASSLSTSVAPVNDFFLRVDRSPEEKTYRAVMVRHLKVFVEEVVARGFDDDQGPFMMMASTVELAADRIRLSAQR